MHWYSKWVYKIVLFLLFQSWEKILKSTAVIPRFKRITILLNFIMKGYFKSECSNKSLYSKNGFEQSLVYYKIINSP